MLTNKCIRNLQLFSRATRGTRGYRSRNGQVSPVRKGNVEQFCYKTELPDCVVLESTNTDWSLVISNQSALKNNKACGSSFIYQLFVKLLSTNPLTTPLCLSTQQGSLTGILKKENQASTKTQKPLGNFSQLCLKFNESDSNGWKVVCSNITLAKAFEESFRSNSDKLKSLSTVCYSSTNDSTNHVEIFMPKSSFNNQNTRLSALTLSKILSHPSMLPFATSSPTISKEEMSPIVENLCL